MCNCTPEKQTPWCGRVGCEPPDRMSTQDYVNATFTPPRGNGGSETRRVNRRLEEQFLRQVTNLASNCGWVWRHFSNSQRYGPMDPRTGQRRMVGDPDAAGWPDLVLIHPRSGLSLFRELKLDARIPSDHKPTDLQIEWLGNLTSAGLDARIWRPADWNFDILPTLAAGRRIL